MSCFPVIQTFVGEIVQCNQLTPSNARLTAVVDPLLKFRQLAITGFVTTALLRNCSTSFRKALNRVLTIVSIASKRSAGRRPTGFVARREARLLRIKPVLRKTCRVSQRLSALTSSNRPRINLTGAPRRFGCAAGAFLQFRLRLRGVSLFRIRRDPGL